MKKLLLTVLALTIAFSAYAERLRIRKFDGLNTRLSSSEIADSESVDMQNFHLDKAGVLTERDLFRHYNEVSIGNQPIRHLYKFYKSSDAGYMINVSNGVLYEAVAGELTSRFITTATVTSTTALWSFETFTDGTNELVYAVTNGHEIMRWNGLNTAFLESEDDKGPADKCNLLKKHKARLFAAGAEAYLYRLYYSSLSNGSDWNVTGGTIDLPSYEKIMALEKLANVLYIYTRTSIYALLGDTPNEFVLHKTRSRVGTHASKSVVLGDKVLISLHKSGVFAFDGDQSVNISEVIQPMIDAISNTYLEEAAGLYDKRGRYWLAYTSTNGSFNDTTLIYDTVIKQWYKYGGNFSAFFKTEGGNDKGELFAGCSDNIGFLWQFQTTNTLEQITHALKSQLETGVTFNTVILGAETSPIVELDLESETEIDGETELLLQFEGADGATTTTDSSFEPHDITLSGAIISTGQYIIGKSSVFLDGNNDIITVPDHEDWNFAANDFTMDLWVYMPTLNASPFIGQSIAAGINWYALWYDNGPKRLRFTHEEANVKKVDILASWTPEVDTWYHVAVVRKGTTAGDWLLFIDGVGQTVTTGGDHDDSQSIVNMTSNLEIGYSNGDNMSAYLNAYLDELRISSVARWTGDFTPRPRKGGGTLISDNLKIGASGQTSLGAITWSETLPDNTDIQFTTRTGPTDDSVWFNDWEGWVSASSVSIETVTSDTAWQSFNSTNFDVTDDTVFTYTRDILNYEPDYETAPEAVEFVIGTGLHKYIDAGVDVSAYTTVPIVNLSGYKFIGFWLRSPVTGQSVRLDFGEVSGSGVQIANLHVTANTAEANTWEKHWWPIDDYVDADIDEISYLQLNYLGESSGTDTWYLYLDEVWAYDFLDSGEIITSTPNDYIQYRAMLGSTTEDTPQLVYRGENVITLSYSISGATTESELTSYWTSKSFDIKNEYNKYWRSVSFDAETQNPTTNNTVYLDYDLNDGETTGTLTDTFEVTGKRVRLKFYFPSGSKGRNMQFTIRDDDLDSDIELHNYTVEYLQEASD